MQILSDTTAANANRNASPTAMRGGPGGVGGGSVPITSDAITRAQGILSDQQLSALKGLQQEQQANALLRQQMRANFQDQTQGRGPTAQAVNQTSPPRTGGGSGT